MPAEASNLMVAPVAQSASVTVWGRVAIGFFQGLAVCALQHAASHQQWPTTHPYVFDPLLWALYFIPLIVVFASGELPRKALLRWLLIATLVLVLLSMYGVWRTQGAPTFVGATREWGVSAAPSVSLLLVLLFGGFIGQTVVHSAAISKRQLADYATLFDTAWTLVIQCATATIFTLPLAKISAIAPRSVLVVAGFVLSLPVTGLEALWQTRHASTLLLVTALMLVILINVAFQNGKVSAQVPRVLRVSAQLASFLLLPLVTIAGYALSLRMSDYGLTVSRVGGVCAIVAGTFYGLGYSWAAVRSVQWMALVSRVNVVTAFVLLCMALALSSPLLDPARLSVNSQVKRLESGQQTAAEFDFAYLRNEGERFGRAELVRLSRVDTGPDAEVTRRRAREALADRSVTPRTPVFATAEDLQRNVSVWPLGSVLPPTFLHQSWADADTANLPGCLQNAQTRCDAFVLKVRNGHPATLLFLEQGDRSRPGAVLSQRAGGDGTWRLVATLPLDRGECRRLRDKLRAGAFQTVEPDVPGIVLEGQRLPFRPIPERNTLLNCDPA